jgi:hypothetical protein
VDNRRNSFSAFRLAYQQYQPFFDPFAEPGSWLVRAASDYVMSDSE